MQRKKHHFRSFKSVIIIAYQIDPNNDWRKKILSFFLKFFFLIAFLKDDAKRGKNYVEELQALTARHMEFQSDGEKSDQDLVVDDASEGPTSPVVNGTTSPRENGHDKSVPPMGIPAKKELAPHSPRSSTSSNPSTPSAKKMEEREKSATPISKPQTPTTGASAALKTSGPKMAHQGPPPPGYPHYPPGPPPHHMAPTGQHPHVDMMAYNGYGPRVPPGLPQQLYDPHAAMRVPSLQPGGKP